jgi:hypothetical protein
MGVLGLMLVLEGNIVQQGLLVVTYCVHAFLWDSEMSW